MQEHKSDNAKHLTFKNNAIFGVLMINYALGFLLIELKNVFLVMLCRAPLNNQGFQAIAKMILGAQL